MNRLTSTLAITAISLASAVAVPSLASASPVSHAIENLAQCSANTLASGDDTVSAPVDLGWTMRFKGMNYSTLTVDTNGKVWLGANMPAATVETRTPDFITSTYETIAPFAADASTAAANGGSVHYGVGADGTFCAIWDHVGYYLNGASYGDLTNTFQLIIRPQGQAIGRVFGDFDIVFNYEDIQWDRGGRATAGYSNSYLGYNVQLPGSHTDGSVAGDFLFDGDNSLVNNASGSLVGGRYVYSITNEPGGMTFGTMVTSEAVITGNSVVGSTLTGRVTGQWGPAPVEMAYFWARDNDLISQDFTSTTYVLTQADVGHAIRMIAVGVKTNYNEAYQESNSVIATAAPVATVAAPQAVIPAALLTMAADAPRITGTAKVGKTLKVSIGKWPAGVAKSYQWYANGKAIKKATGAKLKLVASVRGKKISVKVSGAKSGYTTLVKASKVTKKVAAK